jgi:hypothetical protein
MIAELANALDRQGRVLEAAWAYEMAMRDSAHSLDGILDLVAVYYTLSNPGRYMFAPSRPEIASVAMARARELLAIAIERFRPDVEIETWVLMLRAHRYGENVPFEAFERLASAGSLFAEVVVRDTREQLSARAEHSFAVPPASWTERTRVMRAYVS